MIMFIVNTLGVLHSIPFGVWLKLKYPWGISSSTVRSTLEVLSQTCMYHGGITAGITVGEGIRLIQYMGTSREIPRCATYLWDWLDLGCKRSTLRDIKGNPEMSYTSVGLVGCCTYLWDWLDLGGKHKS